MRQPLRRKLAVALAGALVAGTAAGTVAYATGGVAGGGADTLVACAKNENGQLRLVQNASQCGPSEHAVSFAAATAAEPTSFAVDCTAGERIQPVLDRVAAGLEPVTISVKGMCNEDVSIARDDVALGAASAGSGMRSLSLTDARGIGLWGLTFGTGGLKTDTSDFRANDIHVTGAEYGIQANAGSIGHVSHATITNSTKSGVMAVDTSTLVVSGSSITGSGEDGVLLLYGSHAGLYEVRVADNDGNGVSALASSADLGNSTVEHNGKFGVIAIFGGEASLSNGTVVQGNGWAGVTAVASAVNVQDATVRNNAQGGVAGSNGGHVTLQGGAVVENNRGPGIGLYTGSSLTMDQHATVIVRGNTGDGLNIGDTGTAVVPAPNQIVGNGGWGIYCEPSPGTAVVRGFEGGFGTVSGNAAGQISCPVIP